MKRLLILIGIMFSILPPIAAQEAAKGQWDGNLSFSAGSNFVKDMSTEKYSYSSGDIAAWGRYTTERFMVRVDLQGLSRFAASTTCGSTINIRDLTAPQIDLDVNQNENKIFEESSGVQMEFKPDRQNIFSFNVRQKFNRQTPNKFVIAMKNTFSGEDYSEMVSKYSFDIEEGLQIVNDYNADAQWRHNFDKPGREIFSRIGWALNRNDKSSVWNIISFDDINTDLDLDKLDKDDILMYGAGSDDSGDDPGDDIDIPGLSEKTYRITPLNNKNILNASVLYCDTDLFDHKGLNLELGTNVTIGYDKDRISAANLIDKIWVDSLKYRENFDFLAMDIAPMAKLSYSPDKFEFSFQLTPDFYISKLDSDQNIGHFNFGKAYILPDLMARWEPSSKHNVGFSYHQGIVRPSYLQICWFQRSGAYANELQMGNPNLKPGSNGKASLFYVFHSGFFTGAAEGSATMSWDNIEKVFNTTDEYRIYTWINSGHSLDNSIKLTVKADLKHFNAELGGYYNYFIGYNNAGDVTKSSDWGVNGNASLSMKRGWAFNVRGRYQSKITRSYSSITEYVGCDVKIMKDFKRFSVFVQGNDLFDQMIQVATYSEDQQYARIEENFYNRRIFSLGASINF